MSGEANLERYDDGGQEVYKSMFRSLKGLKTGAKRERNWNIRNKLVIVVKMGKRKQFFGGSVL